MRQEQIVARIGYHLRYSPAYTEAAFPVIYIPQNGIGQWVEIPILP